MRLLSKLFALCKNVLRRGSADIDGELNAYVDERTDRGVASGLQQREARRRALAELGGVPSMTRTLCEQRVGARSIHAVAGIASDLRLGARRLVHNPRFSIPTVLSLALGMAFATAAFSVVNAFVFRPLPIKDGRDLFVLAASRPTAPGLRNLSYPNYVDFRDGNDTFRGLVAYAIVTPRLSATNLSIPTSGQAVSGNYFQVLGVAASLGRVLTPDDDRPGAAGVVVLGYDCWKRNFASDRAVVGQVVRLDGRAFTAVGVTPEGFRGTDSILGADVWLPLNAGEPRTDRSAHNVRVQGFLKSGVTRSQAQANINALTASLREEYPVQDRDLTTRILPERETRPIIDNAGMMVPVGVFLLAIAGLGLMIDGASVTSLLLARSISRQKEIAIRLALGAGRGRLFRQLLIESVLLTLVAGALGLLLTMWTLTGISNVEFPGGIVVDLHPDGTVMLFATLLAITTGIAIGVWPARTSARFDFQSALKAGTPTMSDGRSSRLRAQVVASQYSVLTVLLTLVALLAGSMRMAARADLGFDTTNRLLLTVSPSEFGYDEERGTDLIERFLTRVRTLPGVISAAAVFEPPLGFASSSMFFAPRETPALAPRSTAETVVTPDYFETMGTPLLSGRSFTETDRKATTRVAVVNDTLAAHFWPGQDALGKHLVIPAEGGDRSTFEVIGVAKTGKYAALNETPSDFVWLPYAQRYRGSMTLVVHANGDTAALASAARSVLRDIDSNVALSNVTTLSDFVHARTTGSLQAGALLVAAVALVGFVRAAFSMYGLLSYFAQFQRREIGIRMALGATPAAIVRLTGTRGMKLALRGVTVGLVLAFIAIRVLRASLVGARTVTPTIWVVTWIGVPLLLGLVTLAAAYLPIRRILATGPLSALRQE